MDLSELLEQQEESAEDLVSWARVRADELLGGADLEEKLAAVLDGAAASPPRELESSEPDAQPRAADAGADAEEEIDLEVDVDLDTDLDEPETDESVLDSLEPDGEDVDLGDDDDIASQVSEGLEIDPTEPSGASPLPRSEISDDSEPLEIDPDDIEMVVEDDE